MILIRVDLPAPFSPSTAWIATALDGQSDIFERPDSTVVLADAVHPPERHREFQPAPSDGPGTFSSYGGHGCFRPAALRILAYWLAFVLRRDFLGSDADRCKPGNSLLV